MFRNICVQIIAVTAVLTWATPSTAKSVSIDDFAMKQTAGFVELGPQGKTLSLLTRQYEQICRDSSFERRPADSCDADERELAPFDRILIVDIETMTPIKTVAVPDDYRLNWMEWTSSDNLLISLTSAGRLVTTSGRSTGSNMRVKGYMPPTGRILSVTASDQSSPVVLFGDEIRLLRDNRNLASTVDLLHDDPEHVVMSAWRKGDNDLFKVNVLDGSVERIAKGKDFTYAWYTDVDGKPAIRLDCTTSKCRKVKAYRPEDGADPNDEDTDWIHFRTIDLRRRGDGRDRVEEIAWITTTGKPDEFYVAVEGEGHERRSIKTFNIRTAEFTGDIFSDPEYDVGGAVIDPETGDYAGVALWRDRLEYHLVDETLQKHLNAINAYFDNRWNVSMIGFSNDGGIALVWASAPNDPGAYYLYDFDERHVSRVIGAYEHMPAELEARTDTLSIPTRDGQMITGYHTVPTGAPSQTKQAPLIVHVHGGPEQRDVFDYNRDVQFLASRGFQVLQVNFRGSSGKGRAFAEAGYGEWGGRMHEDVIDAANYLYGKGVASPDTSCIMGHSYGGYAALYAGAVASDQFSCVIAGAGPSDLVESLKQDKKEHGSDSGIFEYWTKSMGDLKTQEAELKAISPARLADQFDDPVLLIHGENDDIVQYSHSEDMYEALTDAGKSVKMLTLDEGHYQNLWAIESSTEYFKTLENFLKTQFPETVQ